MLFGTAHRHMQYHRSMGGPLPQTMSACLAARPHAPRMGPARAATETHHPLGDSSYISSGPERERLETPTNRCC